VDTLSYRTIFANKVTAEKEWVIVDAKDQVLGRLASRVAMILRGKHKASFTPNSDCGDNVIVINAEKIKLTGKKWSDKQYFRHSGYPGGFVISSPKQEMAIDHRRVVEYAVKGMLPKNRLSSAVFANLHVYGGTEHPHAAQQPKEINLNNIK
jgi:large subunit ribosomal protein L13